MYGSSKRTIRAATIAEAVEGLRAALASGPEVRTIEIYLDPTAPEFAPWLDAMKAASHELRGMRVQSFFALLLSRAAYAVVVGRELDIFAKGRSRSLLIEVKSSLEGGRFGSQAVLTQLAGYTTASIRRRAEIWLGIMGIKRPIILQSDFRAEIQNRNIGLVDVRWNSPGDTLLSHLVNKSE